jgi:hypothetical protein
MNMIVIYLIIIDGIVTTNTLQNSSLNHVIFIPSCQATKSALESSKIIIKLFFFIHMSNLINITFSFAIDLINKFDFD